MWLIITVIFKSSMENLHFLTPLASNTHHHNNQFDNYQQKEDYLRRTIDVKNKNIDELLQELRQTKELYQQYKNQYLEEEKKMKGKVMELTNKVEMQNGELDKYRALVNKIKGEGQLNVEREHKNAETYLAQLRELTAIKSEFEEKYKSAMRENGQLRQKNELLLQKVAKLQQKCRSGEKELSLSQLQLRNTRQQMINRNNEWQDQRNRLIEQAQQMEQKKKHKAKMGQRLQAMETRIINTLRKI